MTRSHSSVRDVDEPVEAVLARPVHQDEHRAQLATRPLDGLVDLAAVRDVDLARDRLAALVADVLRGAFRLLEVESNTDTFAPSSASRSVIANPMPDAPPVTIAVDPENVMCTPVSDG